MHRKVIESRLDENANDIDTVNDHMATLRISKPSDATKDVTFSGFLECKDQYYEDRFTGEVPSLRAITHEYMKIIVWTLAYFYDGAVSWRHHYHHPCAPYASDLTACDQLSISLDQDKQIKPFDHLFAVMPVDCLSLLPKCFASLVQEYGDMDWRFDVDLLETATRHLDASLTEAEQARNTWNVPSRYTFVRDKKVAECVKVSVHCNRVSSSSKLY